jgi:hypothetical protein
VRNFANFSDGLTDQQRLAEIKLGDPRINDIEARQYLEVLRDRYERKQELLEQGMSNQLAERFLDHQGWARPFGWHTVFFYPGSNRIRTRYVVFFTVATALFFWVVF